MSDKNENSDRQIVKAGTGVPILESEDEDGFPLSTHGNKSDISKSEAKLEDTNNERIVRRPKKNEKDDVAQCQKENIEPRGTTAQPDTIIPENEVKQKKKNKKKKIAEKVESAPGNEMPNSNGTDESPGAEIGSDLKPSSEKKKEKKKKKQNKQQEIAPTPNAEEKLTEKKGVVEKQEKKEAKSLQVRTFPNGLVIEELVMGKPDGKRASPGKKVSVHYIGKLKKKLAKIF
ncbi:Peptidyl-prolyl cis-trans isomerase FKBP53 [Sesamum alatum]|uniref:peptidylprolyl isomerase n=1 Tax=Sesamum alatum TaxID=300844 RepID=A0AAE1YJQ6_9LAMI|nr:Peptidyl-prolyl cis-trans isomerase FKBP53 [Sesamum alatum]